MKESHKEERTEEYSDFIKRERETMCVCIHEVPCLTVPEKESVCTWVPYLTVPKESVYLSVLPSSTRKRERGRVCGCLCTRVACLTVQKKRERECTWGPPPTVPSETWYRGGLGLDGEFMEQCILKYLRAESEDHYFLLTELPLNTPENREYTAGMSVHPSVCVCVCVFLFITFLC